MLWRINLHNFLNFHSQVCSLLFLNLPSKKYVENPPCYKLRLPISYKSLLTESGTVDVGQKGFWYAYSSSTHGTMTPSSSEHTSFWSLIIKSRLKSINILFLQSRECKVFVSSSERQHLHNTEVFRYWRCSLCEVPTKLSKSLLRHR